MVSGNKTKLILFIWHGNFKLLLTYSLDLLESYGMMRIDCGYSWRFSRTIVCSINYKANLSLPES